MAAAAAAVQWGGRTCTRIVGNQKNLGGVLRNSCAVHLKCLYGTQSITCVPAEHRRDSYLAWETNTRPQRFLCLIGEVEVGGQHPLPIPSTGLLS